MPTVRRLTLGTVRVGMHWPSSAQKGVALGHWQPEVLQDWPVPHTSCAGVQNNKQTQPVSQSLTAGPARTAAQQERHTLFPWDVALTMQRLLGG